MQRLVPLHELGTNSTTLKLAIDQEDFIESCKSADYFDSITVQKDRDLLEWLVKECEKAPLGDINRK